MNESSGKGSPFLAVFSDIRFWILLYFIVRLFNITQPPMEVAHNWRQSTGLMVARNFYEVDNNIFYPRVDMAGEKTGITGTEFPLFNYLIYIAAKLFGWNDWYGRFICLLFSSIGVFWFYRLIKQYINPKVAFWSTLVLLNSLWFAYSRKTMPDTFSVSLMLGALFFGLDYLYKGRMWRVLLFFILCLSSLLSKIPSGFLLVVCIFPFIDRQVPLTRKFIFAMACFDALFPVGLWYFFWVPYLVKEYGFWHYYMGTSIGQGAGELSTHLGQAFEKFYFAALNFIGFATFLAGKYLAVRNKNKKLLWILGLCFATFFVFMLKAGFAFYHHNYYIIPFVPLMAMMAGYTISEIKKPLYQRILIFAIALEVILNALPEFRVKDSEKYKLGLETVCNRYTSPTDLIAINCDKNPQQIYLAHRKGWNITNQEASDPIFLESIKQKGCKILIINKHENQPVPKPALKKLEENQDLCIYTF